MEFDITRAYSALTADELKVGSKVIVADTLAVLKRKVEDESVRTTILTSILPKTWENRFAVAAGRNYGLAYLVKEAGKLEWTDLKIGDIICNEDLTFMVTAIDRSSKDLCHIYAGDIWIEDIELEVWEKVNE